MRVFGAALLMLMAVVLTPLLAVAGLAFVFIGTATRIGFIFGAGMYMWLAIRLLWSRVSDILADAH